MHGNLSVGHAEEENNFSDVSEIIDVHSVSSFRAEDERQNRKKKKKRKEESTNARNA